MTFDNLPNQREAEAEANPTAVAEPEADADAFYGYYGHGLGYSYGHGLRYTYATFEGTLTLTPVYRAIRRVTFFVCPLVGGSLPSCDW